MACADKEEPLSPGHGLRPCLLPQGSLAFDWAILLRLASCCTLILARGLPSIVQLTRGEFPNAPNCRCDYAGAYGWWCGNPGHAAEYTSECSSAHSSHQRTHSCIFGPAHQSPQDELADVSERADESSSAQSCRLFRATRVNEEFEVSTRVD